MDQGLIPSEASIEAGLPDAAQVVDVVKARETGMNMELARLVIFDGGHVSEILVIPLHDTTKTIPGFEELIACEHAASSEGEQAIYPSFHAQKADFSLRPLGCLELVVEPVHWVLFGLKLTYGMTEESTFRSHGRQPGIHRSNVELEVTCNGLNFDAVLEPVILREAMRKHTRRRTRRAELDPI